MDQLALKNLNTLLNINENTSIIFNNKEIIIVEDDLIENIDDNLNIEYTLYFTFNQLINIIKGKTGNKHQLIHNLNNCIENLYENKYFLKLIEEHKSIDEIMEDICTKLDYMIETKYNKICEKLYEKTYDYFKYLSTGFVITGQVKPTNASNIFLSDSDDEEISDDDSNTSNEDPKKKEC